MTAFSLSAPGNVNMASTYATGRYLAKYTQAIYDGQHYIWLIPQASDRIVRLDPETGIMTGFQITGSGITGGISSGNSYKFDGAVSDGTNLWLAPYNADRLVKVSNLDSTPVFTGYDLSTGTNMTATSSTGAAKYKGGVFDGKNIWLIPDYSDRVVRLSDLDDAVPSITGFDMADGPHGGNTNINMTGLSSGTTDSKYTYGAYDGKYIWLPPHNSDRLVRLDPATGNMTGFTLPMYKSMSDDIPYATVGSADFCNYFNNNNWGMTSTSTLATSSASKYGSLCFDGNNLWLCPWNSDRIVKVSTSADETLSLNENTITADLTNYMTQANPYTGIAPSINKIEWVRVNTDSPLNVVANLTYKGNTLSPYIDAQNSATAAQQGFDAAYAAATTTDKGVVYANDYGSQINQSLTFTAPANGTYYVKAYFTDPVNYYGGDPVYNLQRGTPQMVCVIKEINVTLTGVLHIRQVIMNTPPNGLDVPDTGFMQLYNVDPADTGTKLSTLNVTTTSGLDASALGYSTFVMPVTGPTKLGYVINDIIPMYYTYQGYSVTSDSGQVPQGATPVETDINKPILANLTDADEIWVTVYLQPTNNPNNNDSNKVQNVFQKTFGAILTDDFNNPDAPSTGELISKKISAKNTAETDAFVRIQLTPVIVASDGTLLPSDIGPDSGILTADFNDTDWMYGDDGYWYYLGILPPGQTAPDLFENVKIVTTDPAYNNAMLTIQVKCEATGTGTEAYRSGWWGVTDNISGLSGTLQAIDGKLQAVR
jgi:hypothetical protein